MNNASKEKVLIQEIGFARPALSDSERSELERNAESVEPVGQGQASSQVPDPQVLEHPERRRFTVDYKARIVREAEACMEPGQIGALLRREGLFSSQLSTWRRAYRKGALAALKDDKRGRKKTKHPLEAECERLKKSNVRLEQRLSQAEAVIDIQKKLSEILGVPLTSIEIDGAE